MAELSGGSQETAEDPMRSAEEIAEGPVRPDGKIAEESVQSAEGNGKKPQRKRIVHMLRHSLRSFRVYLDECSVRSAFFAYSVIGFGLATVVSLAVASILSSTAENIFYQGGRVFPGLYIYDSENNALVHAEEMDWYGDSNEYSLTTSDFDEAANDAQDETASDEASQADEPVASSSFYVMVNSQSSTYGPSIPIDDPPAEARGLVIHDIDTPGAGPETSEILLEDVPAYDAASNARRGDIEAIADSLPADSHGEKPVVSLVGYYVYVPTNFMYQLLNFAIIVLVPIVFVICLVAASRAFYRRKLEGPIAAMDEAASRIASGDLAFSVPQPSGSSRSELDRLCVSFETMRAELDQNNRAMWRAAENRRKVNAAFAHDLRTPLTVLKGRAEMLSAMAASAQSGGQNVVEARCVAEAADAMERQAGRMQRYVESMKDIAQLDECAVEPREGDLGAWFIRAASEADDLVRCSGKSFEASAGGLPRHVLFDDAALSRVVENALSNALRYAKGVVRMSCAWEGDTVTLCVCDDGPGFDSAALEHACEAFWRDSEAKRDKDSAHFGLGLNICAVLCEKHGGSVALSNDEDGGAVVTARMHVPQVAGKECVENSSDARWG